MVSGGQAASVSSASPSPAPGGGSRDPARAADRGSGRLRTPGAPARRPCGRRSSARATGRRRRPSASQSRRASSAHAGLQEALDVGAVAHRTDRRAARRIRAAVRRYRSGTGRRWSSSGMTCPTERKVGNTESSVGQKPPRRCISPAMSGGMPFISKSISANAGFPAAEHECRRWCGRWRRAGR